MERTRTKPLLSSGDFEMHIDECPICFRKYYTCPGCGEREQILPPRSVYCKIDNIKVEPSYEYLEGGHEMWGYGVDAGHTVYECPVCHRSCIPSLERIPEKIILEK
jgi:hypothetical protein